MNSLKAEGEKKMNLFRRKNNLWIRDRLVYTERMVMITNVIADEIKAERYKADLSGDDSRLRHLRRDLDTVAEMVRFIGRTNSKEEFMNECLDDLRYFENEYMN